jgi:polygalacturonase
MFHCRDIEIYGLHFKNPGSWTLNFADVLNLHLYNVNITVDQINKTEMAIKHGISDEAYHAYPLFTDGMDIRGKNVLVENVHIRGFDDAIGVKEMNWGAVNFDNTFTDCSENMLIRNIIVRKFQGGTKNNFSF